MFPNPGIGPEKLMPSAEALSRLLLKLYAAPTSPDLWPEFLRDLVEMLGLSGAALTSQDVGNERYGVHALIGVDPEAGRLYQEYYGAQDAWRPAFMKKAEGELAFGDELVQFDELRRTEFYNDLLRPFDIRLFCGIATQKEASRFEEISLYHRWKDDFPPRETLDLLELILPHLRAALRVRRELVALQSAKSDFARTLDALRFGLVLLDEHGACVHANRVAEEAFKRADGLFVVNRRVRARVTRESHHLAEIVKEVIRTVKGNETSPGRAMLVSRSGAPLQVFISPFPSEVTSLTRRVCAVLFISDPNTGPADLSETLRTLYGLTPAESRLAELIMSGLSLREAADQNEVSHETVRSQAKAIYAKTGARRQADLIRLMSNIPDINRKD